jgi:hypothetical protein
MLRASVLLGVVILTVALTWQIAVSQQPQAATTLPGARPAIEAINYPSLQAAIEALPPTGGVIRLPAGTFEITAPLKITQQDVLLEGSGTATHIKNLNADGQPALVIEPAKIAADAKANMWRVQIANLRITGSEKSGHGILARHVNEILLHGVTVSYHGGDGVRLDNCYEDPRICDCLLTYNKGAGLNLLGCHDIVVVGNQFEENQDAVRCSDGFNLCFTGNCVDDHLGNGVVIENTYGSVVAGNMIEECNGTAIILDRDCYGITLSANVIAHEVGGGIDLRDAHGCSVSANTFPIVKNNALVIGEKSGRITVTGNNFSNSYIGEGSEKRQKVDSAATGVVLKGTSDITLSGNLFSGLTSKAVTLDKPESIRVLFSGNLLTEVESDHKSLQKSAVSGNLE